MSHRGVFAAISACLAQARCRRRHHGLGYEVPAALAYAQMAGLSPATGIWQMGFVSDFPAKPVVTDFIFGLAVTVVGQLPNSCWRHSLKICRGL